MRYPEPMGGTRDARSYRAPGRWHPTDAATFSVTRQGDSPTVGPDGYWVGRWYGDWALSEILDGMFSQAYMIAELYAGRVLLLPFVLPIHGHLSRIGAAAFNFHPTEAVHVRLGLYKAENYPTDAFAHELIVDAGDCTIAARTMANGGYTYLQPEVDEMLAPGLYWIAMGFPSDSPVRRAYIPGGPYWNVPPPSGVGFSYFQVYEYIYKRILPPDPFGSGKFSGRRDTGRVLGARSPGTLYGGHYDVSVGSYSSAAAPNGYTMAYPNTATYTGAQGALPATLASPSGDIDYPYTVSTPTDHAIFEVAPVLSLLFASFPTGTADSSTSGAPAGAAYVAMDNDATLTAERRLVAGGGIELVDQGGNQPLTVNATAYGNLSGGTAP